MNPGVLTSAVCLMASKLRFLVQLGKSEKAAELESALEKSGHISLLPVFEEMAEAKCFELDKDSDEKESRLWVDNLDPAQLLRYSCPHPLSVTVPKSTCSCWCLVIIGPVCTRRLTGQDTGVNIQPSASQPEALPKPPMQSDFMPTQLPRSSIGVGQIPLGGPPPGAPPPLFPGPPMQPPASLGPGSQGNTTPCTVCMFAEVQGD